MRITFLLMAILLSGCAGRAANPISITRPDDQTRSCATLYKEMEQIEKEIARLMPEAQELQQNNQETKSSFMSYVFLFPLLSMDLNEGQKTEIAAYRQRHQHLELTATEKNCPEVKQ